MNKMEESEREKERDSDGENRVAAESAATNLSKAEAKRVETEKRVKRIHELMVMIEKLNEDLDAYHSELWELLRQQVVLLPVRQRRERKPKEIASGTYASADDGDGDGERGQEGHMPALPPERAAMLEKFFRSKPGEDSGKVEKKDDFAHFGLSYVHNPDSENTSTFVGSRRDPEGCSSLEKSSSLLANSGSGGIKQKRRARARAVSFDETPKKTRMENFEICDIFELKGIEPEFVRECLEKCDVIGDTKLFRQIFIKNVPKEQQILRFVGNKNYQCRRNGLWIDDHNGNYVRHVIQKIFEQSYMIVNNLEHYEGKVDQFFANSEHILEISSGDKYMDNLMSHINPIVDIKNIAKQF
jgi:hypothetical protein